MNSTKQNECTKQAPPEQWLANKKQPQKEKLKAIQSKHENNIESIPWDLSKAAKPAQFLSLQVFQANIPNIASMSKKAAATQQNAESSHTEQLKTETHKDILQAKTNRNPWVRNVSYPFVFKTCETILNFTVEHSIFYKDNTQYI